MESSRRILHPTVQGPKDWPPTKTPKGVASSGNCRLCAGQNNRAPHSDGLHRALSTYCPCDLKAMLNTLVDREQKGDQKRAGDECYSFEQVHKHPETRALKVQEEIQLDPVATESKIIRFRDKML